ncbi:hypothetical protein K438DRAFT_1781588 [Mycena galopus ATCC 62051]|nr:hypothetical protein K438DRAFT_1781588 [Mycena galopus ATCC 62051]
MMWSLMLALLLTVIAATHRSCDLVVQSTRVRFQTRDQQTGATLRAIPIPSGSGTLDRPDIRSAANITLNGQSEPRTVCGFGFPPYPKFESRQPLGSTRICVAAVPTIWRVEPLLQHLLAKNKLWQSSLCCDYFDPTNGHKSWGVSIKPDKKLAVDLNVHFDRHRASRPWLVWIDIMCVESNVTRRLIDPPALLRHSNPHHLFMRKLWPIAPTHRPQLVSSLSDLSALTGVITEENHFVVLIGPRDSDYLFSFICWDSKTARMIGGFFSAASQSE